MIARFLWGYLCIAGISSLLVYCACMAAARADRIKQGIQIKELRFLRSVEQERQQQHILFSSPPGTPHRSNAPTLHGSGQFMN